MALRKLLEDLATSAGAADPAELAAQLHVLVEGLLAAAIIEQRSTDASSVRSLAGLAVAASSAG